MTETLYFNRAFGRGARVLGRAARAGNALMSAVSGLMAFLMILYSSYVLYDTFYTQKQATAWDLMQYRPEIIEDFETPLSDAGGLAAMSPDYRAWLTMFGSGSTQNHVIDYPVMQGENDLYYAAHDIHGNTSLTGAIYMAAANASNFSDSYNIIYGHHMDNSIMFGALDQYRDREFFNNHREGVLVTPAAVYDLYTFAVAETDAYQGKIYTVGQRMSEVVRFLRNSIGGNGDTKTLIFEEAPLAGAYKIVALSTCASADTNGRLVLFAVMTQRGIRSDATGYTGVYDGMAHTLTLEVDENEGTTFSYSTDGGKTWSSKRPTITDVGTIEVLVRRENALLGTDTHFATLTVTPKPATVTAEKASKTVGDNDPEMQATVSGVIDGYVLSYSLNRPLAGTNENVGLYKDALVPVGAALQGNYSVTYIPADFEIIDVEEIIDDGETPLADFMGAQFQPSGSSARSWSVVNLISMILTVYILMPMMHLRDKYGRARGMEKINRESDAELYVGVRSFLRRFRTAIVAELVLSVLAVVLFVLTENMSLPMTLIDRWTPMMLLFLLLSWVIDVRMVRYREQITEMADQKVEALAA